MSNHIAQKKIKILNKILFLAERLYPRSVTVLEPALPEETFDATPTEEAPSAPRAPEEEIAAVAGTSNATTFGNDEGFDEDTQDSIIINPASGSSSKSNGFNLPSVVESDDSEFEEFLDNIIDRGKSILKKGSITSKYPSVLTSGYVFSFQPI